MIQVTLRDIVGLLNRYKAHYKWLDVFASEVPELNHARFQKSKKQENVYYTEESNQEIEVTLYKELNLARFRLVPSPPVVESALLGGLLGAGLAQGFRSSTPAGVLLGLLIGGLLGSQVASSQEQVDENQIATLSFDPESRQWQIYQGPFQEFAKAALVPPS